MDDFLINFSQKLKDQNFNKIHINRGGCGRAAVEFYKYFRKLNKYEVLGSNFSKPEVVSPSELLSKTLWID